MRGAWNWTTRIALSGIQETLGEHCGVIELARVNEEDAMRWAHSNRARAQVQFEPDAARELVDALGADMMLIASRSWRSCCSIRRARTDYSGRRGDDGAGGEAAVALRADRRHQRRGTRTGDCAAAWIAEQLRMRAKMRRSGISTCWREPSGRCW